MAHDLDVEVTSVEVNLLKVNALVPFKATELGGSVPSVAVIDFDPQRCCDFLVFYTQETN